MRLAAHGPGRAAVDLADPKLVCRAAMQVDDDGHRGERIGIGIVVGAQADAPREREPRRIGERCRLEVVEADAAALQRAGEHVGRAQPGVAHRHAFARSPPHEAVGQGRHPALDRLDLVGAEAVLTHQGEHAVDHAVRGAATGKGLVRDLGDPPDLAEIAQDRREVMRALEQRDRSRTGPPECCAAQRGRRPPCRRRSRHCAH